VKLSVEFPSVAYREGPAKIIELGQAIEATGYDEIAVFDHVVMGYSVAGRIDSRYPPKMPVLEALVLMTYLAAHTNTVGLATEVLVLPQRQPALVAKQISTIDALSNGRVRLGVGVGWQESEYDALHEPFGDRGKRMDEAIALLRAYFGDERVDFASDVYPTEAMAMEPKPPQGGRLPIWIGGSSKAAIRRVATIGDGWMGSAVADDAAVAKALGEIRRQAEAAGRDPDEIGLQMMLQPPPTDDAGKLFYADLDAVAARATSVAALGFEWLAVNATAVFQSGARSVDAMAEQLGLIHSRLRAEVG
jgi:probable F420-dependent oxidoreductase